MSDGRPPPALMLDAAAGLRALLSMPRGVDEGVIDTIAGGSETERRDGNRSGLRLASCDVEESGEFEDEGGFKIESTDSFGSGF